MWHESADCSSVIACTSGGYHCIEQAQNRPARDALNTKTIMEESACSIEPFVDFNCHGLSSWSRWLIHLNSCGINSARSEGMGRISCKSICNCPSLSCPDRNWQSQTPSCLSTPFRRLVTGSANCLHWSQAYGWRNKYISGPEVRNKHLLTTSMPLREDGWHSGPTWPIL